MKTRFLAVTCMAIAPIVALIWSQAGAQAQAPAPTPVQTAATERALVNQYCVVCHNEKAKKAGMTAAQAITLDTHGYRHSYLLLTAAQAIVFDIPGVGSFSRNLTADWNRLDYPSGTRLSVATDPAAPVNGLLRLQDEPIDV